MAKAKKDKRTPPQAKAVQPTKRRAFFHVSAPRRCPRLYAVIFGFSLRGVSPLARRAEIMARPPWVLCSIFFRSSSAKAAASSKHCGLGSSSKVSTARRSHLPSWSKLPSLTQLAAADDRKLTDPHRRVGVHTWHQREERAHLLFDQPRDNLCKEGRAGPSARTGPEIGRGKNAFLKMVLEKWIASR